MLGGRGKAAGAPWAPHCSAPLHAGRRACGEQSTATRGRRKLRDKSQNGVMRRTKERVALHGIERSASIVLVGTIALASKTHCENLAAGYESPARVGRFSKMLLVRADGVVDGLVSMGREELTNTWQLPHGRRLGPLQNPWAGRRDIATRDEELPEGQRTNPRTRGRKTSSIGHAPRIRIIHGKDG